MRVKVKLSIPKGLKGNLARDLEKQVKSFVNNAALDLQKEIKANAPGARGNLKRSILIDRGYLENTVFSGLVYARQREHGGVIAVKKADWLHFPVDKARTRWVKVKEVTQKGAHYWEKALKFMIPRINRDAKTMMDRFIERVTRR